MNMRTTGALPRAAQRLVFLFAGVALLAPGASAQILVGDVFVDEFAPWTDTFTGIPAAGALPSWGTLLTDSLAGGQYLIEDSDGRAGDGTGTDGDFTPYLLVNTTDVTPATYDLSATMATYDNDGFGLVFGYQDNDNYFRFSFREQTPGNLGFPHGASVQKVVEGVATQIGWDEFTTPITGGIPFNVEVNVDGANWSVSLDGFPIFGLAGNDPDLQPGNYGVHSWGQGGNGTIVQEMSVASTTLNTTHTFSGAIPTPWRALEMVNADFLPFGTPGGSFRQAFANGTIEEGSNGFEYGTTTAPPNTDFIGPAVVVDDAASAAWTNYEMTVRIQSNDNDGIGLLVRVADNDSFYRIMFDNQALEGDPNTFRRPVQGMSVQKYDNGTWSQVFGDDQNAPAFVYDSGVPFDVRVQVVGDQMFVQVVNDPEGTPGFINYPIITDGSSPILAGTVGLTDWGNDDSVFGRYGGDGDALLRAISSFRDPRLTVDRATGNLSLADFIPTSIDIKGYSILSTAGGLDQAEWTPISGRLDAPSNGGDGSVDPDDPWTVLSQTSADLTEAEISGGDGGTIDAGEVIDLGNAWLQSRIEDLIVELEFADGSTILIPVIYVGTPYERSDLDTDGAITGADWELFYPNTLADLSSLSLVEQALAGDLDGDGDNDVIDFGLFKGDFDDANGAGSFDRMLAGVPEPSGLILSLIGALVVCGFKKRIGRGGALLASVAIAVCLLPSLASAVDFTTFTVENYPEQNTFPLALWDTTPTTATVSPTTANAGANVFYSTEDVLNTRILGNMVAGADDDMVGLVLGFNPGDTFFGSGADFLLMDWKGVTQTFDFVDVPGNFFHDLTFGEEAPAGLALSSVTGVPTADELWGHVNAVENVDGGVEELARGATLGATGYPNATAVAFDVQYSSTNVTVSVDGVEQFNIDGAFGGGRFGLYTLAQSPPPVFSDFEIIPLDQVLTATVDRGSGEIVLSNQSAVAVDFDYYQFDSASGSLDEAGWTSLDDADGPGVGWDEAGGSDSTALGELYLQGSTQLAPSASVSIGNAYGGTSVADEDLELIFRLLPFEAVLGGVVEYTGEYSAFLEADFDRDGDVDGDDFLAWQGGFGTSSGAQKSEGDYDNDGDVDGDDFLGWQAEFGSAGGSGSEAVPEPSSFGLLAFAVAGLGGVLFRRCV